MNNRFDGYIIEYLPFDDYPEILRFVRPAKRTIYINTAARLGANIIRLVISGNN